MDEAEALNQAMQALSAAEAAEASVIAPNSTPASAPTPDPAPGNPTPEPVQSPDPDKPADAPATADPNAQPKPDAQKPDKGSPFAKNQQRLEGGWKSLNEQKAAFKAEQDKLKAERDALINERKAFDARQQAANKPKYTPEQVEQRASEIEREAEALEARGEFEKADERKFQAKNLKNYAAELRANPPQPAQTDEQAEKAFATEQKQWWGKAAIDFPSVAKDGTPEAAALKALLTDGDPKFDPILAEAVVSNPKGLYYVSRLVCAETAAAGAAQAQKELGELRAKVKDLSEKLSIPGEGAAAPITGEIAFEAKSPQEQEAELRRQAELESQHRF